MYGVRLILFHPEWLRSCKDCETYLYDDDGSITRRPARIGLPQVRPRGTITPCWKCPKVPSDAPERTRRHAIEMTPENMRAFAHYRECRAVNWQVPEASDPIVRRHARIIQRIEDELNRLPMLQFLAAVGRKLT
jgi:hypothetical protein